MREVQATFQLMGRRGTIGLMVIFLIFCLFPYLKAVPIPVDTQPTGLVLGMLLMLLMRKHQAGAGIWMVGGIMIAAIILFAAGEVELSAIRNIIGYVSIFVFGYLFFNIAISEKEVLRKCIDAAIIIWFLVGFMQVVFGRGFLVFLISDARTTDGRGVTSLAPEPTYYASQMLFLLLMHMMLGLRKYIVAICLFSILFLAISSQVVLIIFLATGVCLPFLLGRQGFGFVLLASLLVGGLAYGLFEDYKNQYRIFTLIDIVIRNPAGLLLIDASANERFAAIYVSFKSFFANYMLPHGISGNYYYESFLELKKTNPEFLWAAAPSKSNLSGVGRIAFELGGVIFLFIGIVVVSVCRLFFPISLRVFIGASYLLIMITAIPLAHPMPGAVLGIMIACGRRPRIESPALFGASKV
jgi:hypothetical protein